MDLELPNGHRGPRVTQLRHQHRTTFENYAKENWTCEDEALLSLPDGSRGLLTRILAAASQMWGGSPRLEAR